MEKKRSKFVEDAGAMREDLIEWCKEHPESTLDEIVGRATKSRREIMGQLVQEVIEEAKGQPGMEACPACGGELENRGKNGRWISHYEGETEIKRRYYYCPRCKRGFFPPG